MFKILCFKFREPYEKIAEAITKAKESKSRIEFTNIYLAKKLNEKQLDKYSEWLEENKSWLEGHSYSETQFERLQQQIPGLWVSGEVDTSKKTYFVFDFRF